MSLRNYYLKEFPGNEWKLYREREIDGYKYAHYRTGNKRELTKNNRVSFLKKEDGESVLITQRYKEGMQNEG